MAKAGTRKYTTKQMGDACEMLVAAELTLAGVPALRVPDFWPGYDVIAQPVDSLPQKISVKSRTFKTGSAFVGYDVNDQFDWLAIVLLPSEDNPRRQIFLVPRRVAAKNARKYPTSNLPNVREYRIDQVEELFSKFRNNFSLSKSPA